MLQYESIFITDPTITDEELDALLQGYEKVIEGAGAKVLKQERWGKRRLAYTINGHEDGIYVLLTLECEPQFVKELERRYRMNERIIRHLTVRVENEAQLGPSPMMKTRPAEREETPAPPPAAP
jgi:small subunit ribosomal protein S6